ncbi:hypothetical protein CMUS01_16650 [Colletotrichum musicola]|uniref:Uncharacterized protein n=1 Tax=Colletotrichum musicola TaxID=2175873 RepID=A0A8H6ILA9_9PEZI|nr:hypothetical protein CMUS01_16650 [Colletotrichum musicola]
MAECSCAFRQKERSLGGRRPSGRCHGPEVEKSRRRKDRPPVVPSRSRGARWGSAIHMEGNVVWQPLPGGMAVVAAMPNTAQDKTLGRLADEYSHTKRLTEMKSVTDRPNEELGC